MFDLAVLVVFVFDEASSILIHAAFAIWSTKFSFLCFILKIVAVHQASIHLATIHQAAIHLAIIYLATIEICSS